MSQDIINEVYFLAYSVAMGAVITFMYDFLLIGRQLVKHGLFFISLEDFLFWAACAVAVFYMLYEENNGILRWFAVLGAALGMLLYKKLIGTHFVRLVSGLIRREVHLIKRVLKFIFRPVRWVLKKISSFCCAGCRKMKIVWKYMKNKLTSFKRMFRIILNKH